MATYTIKSSLLENCLEKRYIANILFAFIQDNPNKVAVDKQGIVLDIYKKIIENGGYLIAEWISLLTQVPVSVEPIDVDLSSLNCHEELFITLCFHTKGQKKMLINSHQEWKKYDYCAEMEHCLKFNDTVIKAFDRDESIQELSPAKQVLQIENSVVATNNSSISNTKNTN